MTALHLPFQARTISAAGVLGPSRTLSAAGHGPHPQIASDADGDAVAVWPRSDGSNYRVQARTISAAGVLGPTRTLSAAGQDASPPVASDADGDAVAVWYRAGYTLEHRAIEARTISAAGVLGPNQYPVRRRARRTPRSQATATATRSRSGSA